MSSPKPRVLIVEDEAVTALSLQDGLAEYGFDVCAMVMTAADAVGAANAHRPDVALVDLRLKPDPDGEEFTGVRLAEELWVCDRIPVVFITAHTDPDVLQQIERTGAFGFVAKPFTIGSVAASLRVALAKNEEQRAELRAAARGPGAAHD